MRKRAVRLRHFVGVFAFLDRIALTGGRVLDFLRERVRHSHSFTIVRILDDPASREGNLARRRHFHGHLISRATDATRFYFQPRTNILDRLVYNFQRIDRIRTFARFVDRRVHNPFRERSLAALHNGRNEARHGGTPVAGIDALLFFVNSPPSRHCRSFYRKLFLFGRSLFRCAPSAASAFRSFRSIFGAAASTSIHAKTVERTTHNVVAHTGQILHASSAHEHDGVLLQIVSLAWNVGNHFLAIRQPHFCHFAQGRIRLLRRARHHLHAHTAPLRAIGQRR